MILVCPSCDAKFKIPDGAIPAGGRTVRCAKCKNSWHATPTQIMRKSAPRPAAAAAPSPVPPPRPPAPAPQAFDGKLDAQAAADADALRRSVRGTIAAEDTPAVQSAPEPEMFDEGLGGPPVADDNDPFGDDAENAGGADDFGIGAAAKKAFGDDLPDDFDDDGTDPDGPDADDEDYDEDDFLARRRADQRRLHERKVQGRWRKIMTIGWSGLLIFWLVVFYGFMFEEENMRHYLPGTSDVVYDLFSGTDADRFRPEEGETLTPSPAEAEVYIRANLYNEGSSQSAKGVSIETVNGVQTLVLRGYVENAGTTGANVPQVRASILDSRGGTITSWVFNPPGLIIRRGQQLKFTQHYSPVPPNAVSAKVDVVEGSKSTPAADNN
jgi:predicted Zn finger-like uncharacterized protein